jgi:tetratricopeptide (TPR) repeat protein
MKHASIRDKLLAMANAASSSITVPPDEMARQATAALQGYTYQLYQTVSAWLSLRSEELLHVEFAEDFAVSDDGKLTITQIKLTKASLTLRSKGVVALIAAAWRFQRANPGRTVVAALISKSKFGKEKGLRFPGGVPGLSYWRAAAREQADIEPIRSTLLDLKLPADLEAFLKDGTPEEIRRQILRPIKWLASGPSQDEIEKDLHEKLVYFGDPRGVGAQDSMNALNALIGELLACAQRPAASRFVTAADLLTVFQKNTYRLIPPSALQRGSEVPATFADAMLADASATYLNAASIPLPPRPTLRRDLVKRLHGELVANGALWLHGSSGLGKTTLALLLARQQQVAWSFADLRDLAPHRLRLVLTRFGAKFSESGARGLILDDVPADPDNATIQAIARVARAVHSVDGVLVVTCMKPPPPTLLGGLNVAQSAVQAVPYLTEDDVREIVAQAGGDVRMWAPVIYMLCGGGHPQLVDARVVGLRQRGWPREELLADLAPPTAELGELEQERSAVRARLLHEAGADSREMLLRLSLLLGNFDRPMVLAIATATPPLRQAGLVFDSLVGPWIEHVGPERYRLSPLLRDSGEAGLDDTTRTAIRMAVVDHLLMRSPFPADQLLQVFMLALPLKHIRALAWFAGAIAHTYVRDKDLFKRLAEEVSVVTLVDRDNNQPLLPEDVHVSTFLRYAQFLIAIGTGEGKRAAAILDRLLSEIEALPGKFKTGLIELALGSALIARSVPLPPKRWLEMLRTLTALPGSRLALKTKTSHNDPYSDLTVSATHDENIFIIRATALNGIDELCELIDGLEAELVETRDRYLTAASNLSQSIGHIVSFAWLSDTRSEEFDGNVAAQKLHILRDKAARWKNTDLVVELACAEAVMLAEYAGDKQAALDVLNTAQVDYPHDYRINRQRQKVYYFNGDHDLALAEFESFVSALPDTKPIDRAFAMREAGRSAAEIGEFDKTRRFFEQGWESATKCGAHMLPMVAGLSADCAILDFQAGRIDSALHLMVRALTEAEKIDPDAGLREHYCVLILGTAIIWMRGQEPDWSGERQQIVIGMCSNPAPLAEFKDRPLPPRLLAWYLLAVVEADASESREVYAALRNRTKAGALLPMETMLPAHFLRASIRASNLDRFLEILPTYARAVAVGGSMMADMRTRSLLEMPTGSPQPVGTDDWTDPSIQEATVSAILAFALALVCSGKNDAFEDLRTRVLQTPGLSTAAESSFATISTPVDRCDDLHVVIASTVGLMLQLSFVFDAREAFMASVYIIQLLSRHVLGEAVAAPVVEYFSRVWRDILANRSFSVRAPNVNGPLILDSVTKTETALAKLAHLILASEAAVKAHLSPELRGAIRAITQLKPVQTDPTANANQAELVSAV